jgi:hypothetical protein
VSLQVPLLRLYARLGALALAITALIAPVDAAAAPPPNDAPTAPGFFEPYTAENGRPDDLQAVAELAEAQPDRGVPQCFGSTSFARTVWYYVPASDLIQEVAIEASGRTLNVIDLAAYVQPEGTPPGTPVTRQPNVCAGSGSTDSAAAEEPTSALFLRVPARHPLLVQVGRRGAPGTPDDERAVLSLDVRPAEPIAPPLGDIADFSTPSASTRKGVSVPMAGATTSGDDPAEPACPSLGTVWRRVTPRRTEPLLVRASGVAASNLTVFSGTTPTAGNALDCVNRVTYGSMLMRVQARRKRPLWFRLGSDEPRSGASAKLYVTKAKDKVVVDGGPGGSDPTTGGPGGGLPSACEKSKLARARITGSRIRGTASAANRHRNFVVPVRVRGNPVCDVTAELRGPRGRVYAKLRKVWLKGRTRLVLRRTRRLVKGVYRLHVVAQSELGDYSSVRSSVKGRLR